MNMYKCALLTILLCVCSVFVVAPVEARHHSRTHVSINIGGGSVCERRCSETYVIERHYPAYVNPYIQERVYVPARPYYEQVRVVPAYRERVVYVQPRFNFGWLFSWGL